MRSKLLLLSLALLSAAPSTQGTWTMLVYPLQWLRDIFTSDTPEEFSRRIGELEEYNATFLNDSRRDVQLWPNLTVPEKTVNLTRTSGNVTLPKESGNFSEVVGNSTAAWNDSVEDLSFGNGDNLVVVTEVEEDKWKDYFEQLLTHDTEFCFSLLVCEISASPDNFLEYGRRVARFFETYRPSSSNSAAWWYVNAAELGRKGRSLAECRANYPFCFVDTRQLVALLDVPAAPQG